MQLDLATVMVQVATGGLLFCWVTTRRREVGIGYGWLLRISFGTIAILGVIVGVDDSGTGAQVRNVGAAVMAIGAAVALWVSYVRRGAGVSGQREQRRARAERVAAMVGTTGTDAEAGGADDTLKEFDPRLDLVAPIAGIIAVAGAAAFVGGDYALSLARLEIGAFFLGAVTDAMLLGHWYLVQPGPRARSDQGARDRGRGAVAARAARVADTDRHGVGDQRHHRRRLRRSDRVDVDRGVGHHDRARHRDRGSRRRSGSTPR